MTWSLFNHNYTPPIYEGSVTPIVNEDVTATNIFSGAATFSEHAVSLLDTDNAGNVMICTNLDTAEMRFSDDFGQTFSVVSSPDLTGFTLTGGNAGVTCLRYNREGGYWALGAISGSNTLVIWVSGDNGATWIQLDRTKAGVTNYGFTFSWGFGFNNSGGIIAAVMGLSNTGFLVEFSDPINNQSPTVSDPLSQALNYWRAAWQFGSTYWFLGESALSTSSSSLASPAPSINTSSATLTPGSGQAPAWTQYPAVSSSIALVAQTAQNNATQTYYAFDGSEVVDNDGTVSTAVNTLTVNFSESVRTTATDYDPWTGLWFVSGFTESQTDELIVKTARSHDVWPVQEQKVTLSTPPRSTGYTGSYLGYRAQILSLGDGSFLVCYYGSTNTLLVYDRFSLTSAVGDVITPTTDPTPVNYPSDLSTYIESLSPDIFYKMDDGFSGGVAVNRDPTFEAYLHMPIAFSSVGVDWTWPMKPWAVSNNGQAIMIHGARLPNSADYSVSRDGGVTWDRRDLATDTFNENGYTALTPGITYSVISLDYSNQNDRWYMSLWDNSPRDQRLYYSDNDGATWNRFIVGSNTENDPNAPNYFCYGLILQETGSGDKITIAGRYDGNAAIPDPAGFASSVSPFSSHTLGATDATTNSINGYYPVQVLNGEVVALADAVSVDYLAFWSSGLPDFYSVQGLGFDRSRTASSGSVFVAGMGSSGSLNTTKTYLRITNKTQMSSPATYTYTLPAPPVSCYAVDYSFSQSGGWRAVSYDSTDKSLYIWQSVDALTWTGPTQIILPQYEGRTITVDTQSTQRTWSIPLYGTTSRQAALFRASDGGSVYSNGMALVEYDSIPGGYQDTTLIPGSIIDIGTKQYPNTANGSVLLQQSPVIADGGFSIGFGDTSANIRTGSVAATSHTHVFIFNLEGVQDGTTIFNNGVIAIDFSTTIRVNFIDTGRDNTTRYLVIKQAGTDLSVYSGPSLTPVATMTVASTTSVNQLIQGPLVEIDWYVLTPNANYVLEELIEELDAAFPLDQYDPNTGIAPTDVTPQFFGGQRGESQPTTNFLPGCWHIRDDGFGVCFAGARGDLFYSTTDFGDTWTGPTDLEATLAPDDNVPDATWKVRVGNINYFGGVYSFGAGWRSSGGSRRSCGWTTTDFVTFSSRLANAFYGWNYLVGPSGQTSYNARNAPSNGNGFTVVSGSTVDVVGIDNGGSTAQPGSGTYTLTLYQNGANSKTSTGAWTDLDPNPVTSSFVRMATKPGSSNIWYVDQKFDGSATPTAIPLTATDHLETGGLANYREGGAGYQSGTGNLMRSWIFGTGTNDNNTKIHFEINPTGADGDWGGAQGVGKGYLNLAASGLGLHNAFNGTYQRILGAGQYWFMSYLDDSNGEGLRILRFRFPLNTLITPLDPPPDPPIPVDPVPDPDPDPGPTTPEPVLTPYVRCIINSEDSEILYTNGFGSLWRVPGTQWATANDITSYSRISTNADVFSTNQSDLELVTTSPVKFGTKAMRTYPADDVNNGSGSFYDTNNNWRGLRSKASNSMYGDISWTIEQWMTGGTNGLYPHFGSSMRGSSSKNTETFSYGLSIWFQKAGTTYRGYLVIGGPPSVFTRALTIQFNTNITSWSNSTFRHVAVQRRRNDSGDTEWDMYVDGALCSKRSISGDINAIVVTGDVWKFGTKDYSINIVPGRLTVSPSYGGPAPVYKARFSYSGVYMDSFRLTINDALYETSFTPPAGPYLP